MGENPMAFGMKERWRSLTRDQQLALGILAICGVAVFFLSVLTMYDRIRAPFYVPNNAYKKTQEILAKLNEDDTKLERSKTKDTDRDGLTDYQELNTYHTSPYLPDTDSDGAPDAVEIARGTNPTCPEGKPCTQAMDVVVKASTSTSGFEEFLQTTKIPVAPMQALLGGASSTQGANDFLLNAPDPSTLSTDQIASYLVQRNLVTQEQLDALTPQQVKEVYQAAYKDALNARAILKQNQGAEAILPTP
jgi:hypothetical protein